MDGIKAIAALRTAVEKAGRAARLEQYVKAGAPDRAGTWVTRTR